MTELSKNSLTAKIEAFLFIQGEPVTIKKICKTLNQKEPAVIEALGALETALGSDDRGLALLRSGAEVQLTTKPAHKELAEQVMKDEFNEALTPAALETLAIIAYGSPVSRSIIDYIRGVNSTFILRNLLMRGLIERNPDPSRGNAYVYGPSFELLRHLGIPKNEALPEYGRFRDIIAKVTAGE